MKIDSFKRWPEAKWLVVVLLTASLVTHFIWLGYPGQVIFDEVHFGKFVTAYCCTHERFFDIHPPHAKLLIAGTAYVLGYRGGVTFEHIGQSYGAVNALPFRLFPAIMGTLLPLLVYVLLRQLKASRAAAFLGSALVILDNALTIQTRIIALDGLLLVSILGALIAFFAAKKRERITWKFLGDNISKTNKRQRVIGCIDFRKEGWLFVLAGGLAGLAVGTKFTGLLAGGLLFVLFMVWVLQVQNYLEVRRVIFAMVLVAFGATVIYLLGWMIHFMLLTESGSGDLWRKPEWSQPIMTSFLYETKEIHRIMYEANSGLAAKHHDGSPWWSWPLVRTPVFYWQTTENIGADQKLGAIYFMANPILWWGATILLLTVLLSLLLTGATWVFSLRRFNLRPMKLWMKVKADWQGSFLERAWLPLVGYFASYIPLMTVTRVLFLYHYLTPLLFSLFIVVLWLDYVGWIKPISVLKQNKYYWIMLAVVGLSFLFFSPLTYGFLLSGKMLGLLFWFSSWR